MVKNQGGIYWISLGEQGETEEAYTYPCVVIQDNVLNQSRVNTLVVCVLTSNMNRVNSPGNVLLEAGEANLPKQSVVEVSKVSSINQTQLGETIGLLTEQRIDQSLAGMKFLQLMTKRRK